MDIQKLIDEVVAKLRELNTALGDQRSKVQAAIAALTGETEEGETMTPEQVQMLKQELAALKMRIGQVGQ